LQILRIGNRDVNDFNLTLSSKTVYKSASTSSTPECIGNLVAENWRLIYTSDTDKIQNARFL